MPALTRVVISNGDINMAKSLFRAIAAFALAAFAPTTAYAGAVLVGQEYTFDFSSAFLNSSATTSNSMTFYAYKTSDASKAIVPTLQVKVSAWSIDRNPFDYTSGMSSSSVRNASSNSLASTSNDVVTQATLKLWSGGLGVQNMWESDTSPNHSMDNGVDYFRNSSGNLVSDGWGGYIQKYMVDFVTLQFSWDVDVDDITTGWIGTGSTPDSDATIRYGTGNTADPSKWSKDPKDPTKTLDLTGAKVNGSSSGLDLSDYFNMNVNLDSPGPATTGTRCVNNNSCGGTPQHGMIWLLGALYGTDSNDYFKLDALNVFTTPTVPEPSTWMSMILGFGMIGVSLRRRQAMIGKSATANA